MMLLMLLLLLTLLLALLLLLLLLMLLLVLEGINVLRIAETATGASNARRTIQPKRCRLDGVGNQIYGPCW